MNLHCTLHCNRSPYIYCIRTDNGWEVCWKMFHSKLATVPRTVQHTGVWLKSCRRLTAKRIRKTEVYTRLQVPLQCAAMFPFHFPLSLRIKTNWASAKRFFSKSLFISLRFLSLVQNNMQLLLISSVRPTFTDSDTFHFLEHLQKISLGFLLSTAPRTFKLIHKD